MPEQARPNSFFGAILKAIACTPNRTQDPQTYQRGVIEPARRIRELQAELGGQAPSAAQVGESISLLQQIFHTKEVDPTERQDRIREIVETSGLRSVLDETTLSSLLSTRR